MHKIPGGISAFFPAYNDGGTIPSMVLTAVMALRQVSDDFEVIVVNDGSADYTQQVLEELASRTPELRVIKHEGNKGYGMALRTGFASATKDWIFYTDGDAQYNPLELARLAEAWEPGVDVVNGYKISRNDPLHRKIIGRVYHYIVKWAFGFKLRDVDCDFRLIRRALFDQVQLESVSGTICLEMVKKFQDAGFVFREAPVHHFHRTYGKSQFFNFRHLWKTFTQLYALWLKLVWQKNGPTHQAQAAPTEIAADEQALKPHEVDRFPDTHKPA